MFFTKYFNWNNIFSKKERIVLYILFLIGIVIRVYAAHTTLLWRDEVYIIETSFRNSFWNLLLQNHWDTAHPPLYFIFLHYWQLLGASDFFLRIPSLFASVGILWLIPVISKQLLPKTSVFPALALFFFSFSHTQISLNIVARPYPFVLLFMLLSISMFLRILNANESVLRKVDPYILGIFLSMSFYFDYSTVWLLATLWLFTGLWFIFYDYSSKRFQFIFQGLLVGTILCQLWMPVFFAGLNQALDLEKHLYSFFKGVNPFLANLWQMEFFAGTTPFDFMHNLNPQYYSRYFLIMIAAGLTGIACMYRESKRTVALLFLMFFTPLTLSFIVSVIFVPIFQYRNLLLSNLPVLFGYAYLTSIIFSKSKYVPILILIYWVVNFFQGFPMIHYVDQPVNWNKAANILLQDKSDQILILTDSKPSKYDTLKYYFYKNRELLQTKKLSIEDYQTLVGNNTNISAYFSSFSGSRKTNYVPVNLQKKAKEMGCRLNKIEMDYLLMMKCQRLHKD